MDGRTTISDVARAAGVGVGTVSRVINRAPGVSREMAQRVQAVIARLGWQPAAPEARPGPRRRAASRQTGAPRPVVELVVLFRLGVGWMAEHAPVYAAALDGIAAELEAAGYELQVAQGASWRPEAASGSCAGRIFFGAWEAGQEPPTGRSAVPTVWVMGMPPPGFTGDHVQVDHTAIGELAGHHLLALGHRTCAYLGSALGSPESVIGYRGDAFASHLQRRGGTAHLLLHPGLIRLGRQEHRPDAGVVRTLLVRMLGLSPRPTALFVQADMVVPAVYRACKELGVLPQRELTVITCNNESRYLGGLRPAPLVIDIHAGHLGTQAARALIARIAHAQEPALRITVRPTIAG